jgi:hypothetical protein
MSVAKDYSLNIIHQEPKTTNAIGLPNLHYKRIYDAARRRRMGVTFTDKNGQNTRFYIHKGELFGRKYMPDGTVDTQPVFDVENLPKNVSAYNNTKDKVREQIRKDFPDYTDEKVEAYADIIEEGSMTARRLAATGIPINVAHKIVFSSLNSENIDESFVERWLTENASTNTLVYPPPPTSP